MITADAQSIAIECQYSSKSFRDIVLFDPQNFALKLALWLLIY